MIFSKLFSKSPKAEPVFALPEGVRVYAVGDIHGKGKLLTKLLAAIEEDARARPTQKAIEVFLGDYVDRGLESREVIDMLLQPSTLGHERVCLKGNHEETMLQFFEDPKVLRDWGNYGGYATLHSYGVSIPPSMSPEKLAILRDTFRKNVPEPHIAFLKNLRLTYALGGYLFVHAGIMPGIPLNEQRSEHMLWIRGPFLKHQDFFSHYVVHGHSPVEEPQILKNRANIDVSVAPQESLCCLVLEGTERKVMIVH